MGGPGSSRTHADGEPRVWTVTTSPRVVLLAKAFVSTGQPAGRFNSALYLVGSLGSFCDGSSASVTHGVSVGITHVGQSALPPRPPDAGSNFGEWSQDIVLETVCI
jgi:hypothetical protein